MSLNDKYENLKTKIFKDERSKEVLGGIILAMLTGNEKFCAEVMEINQYFCLPPFLNTGSEIFIDAGAYVGDTVEKFIWANNGGFKQIYAFEPGPKQFEALTARKERLVKEWALKSDSITIINGGLAEKEGYASLIFDEKHLLGTTLNEKTEANLDNKIKLYSLDSFLSSNYSKGTFLKSDIEGMEMSMMHGAKGTIERNKPKMALSTYHEPDDLFEIIDFVTNLVSEYRLALRHHSPMLMDTTLYCWIED